MKRSGLRRAGGASVGRLTFGLLVLGLALVLPGGAGAANPTTLSINCTPKGLSPGQPASCAATVTDTGPVAGRVPPSGVVSFTSDGEGSFEPADGDCLLEPAGAFSSKCTVSYTPTAISGGSRRLAGTYGGDEGHGRATAAFSLSVTPVNDERDAATPLAIPAKLSGTTEGATFGYEDDPDLCSDAYAPVWYVLKPVRSQRLAVRLTVKGRVDSVVAVFRQERSKLADLGCELTDASGIAGVPFDATAGTTYLIAVAAPWDARSGGFTLESAVVPPVELPGARLARDAELTLDPLLHPTAAFSLRLRPATGYRINATGGGACLHLSLLQRARAGGEPLAKSDGCSGYLVHTSGSGSSGPLTLLVSLTEGRLAKVHVALRTADPDDLAPGRPLADASVRHGSLSARDADVVDVYRFRVPANADATLTLSGGVRADLLLLSSTGKQLGCACDGLRSSSLVQRLGSGSYYAILRGRPAESGSYALTLRLRQPTATAVRLLPQAGSRPQLALTARVRPGQAGGRVTLELQRFDPLSGWQFAAAAGHRLAGGRSAFTLSPKIGGWRVRARYGGSLSASPSASDWITFTVDDARAGHAKRPQRTPGCAPAAPASFTVGTLTLSCTSGTLGGTTAAPSKPASSLGEQLRALKTTVSGIPLLKEPFKSQLLADLDGAISALADKHPDLARAKLDDFISVVGSAPLKAQLTADQQRQLATTAKEIESKLGAA